MTNSHRLFRRIYLNDQGRYREEMTCLDCGIADRLSLLEMGDIGPTTLKHLRRSLGERLGRFACAVKDDAELRAYVAGLRAKYEEGGEYRVEVGVGEAASGRPLDGAG